MPNQLSHQLRRTLRRKKSSRDFTKDSSTKWFVVLLVLVAIYIILDSLPSKNVKPGSEKPVQTRTTDGFTPPST